MSKSRDTVENLRTVLVAGDVTNANFTGADLDIAKGGTGSSTAGAARTALGLDIGSDVLAPNGDGSNLTGLNAVEQQTQVAVLLRNLINKLFKMLNLFLRVEQLH